MEIKRKLVHKALNSYGKNLSLTVDTFNNVAPHFFDIEIYPDCFSIYCEESNIVLFFVIHYILAHSTYSI